MHFIQQENQVRGSGRKMIGFFSNNTIPFSSQEHLLILSVRNTPFSRDGEAFITYVQARKSQLNAGICQRKCIIEYTSCFDEKYVLLLFPCHSKTSVKKKKRHLKIQLCFLKMRSVSPIINTLQNSRAYFSGGNVISTIDVQDIGVRNNLVLILL